MGLALRSAEIAAGLLVDDSALRHPARTRRLLLEQHRALTRLRAPATFTAGELASCPIAGEVITRLLQIITPLRYPVLGLMGKVPVGPPAT